MFKRLFSWCIECHLKMWPVIALDRESALYLPCELVGRLKRKEDFLVLVMYVVNSSRKLRKIQSWVVQSEGRIFYSLLVGRIEYEFDWLTIP